MDDEDEFDPFDREFEGEDSAEDDREQMNGESTADSGDDEDEEDGTSGTDFSDDEPADSKARASAMISQDDRTELLKAMTKDQKAVASSLAQSVKADAEKGRAVKKQQATFDSLLNARIKLQKTLVGTNTIVGTSEDDLAYPRTEARDVIEAAETAAFNLLSSLNKFRDELQAARTGEKRKRDTFAANTPTEDLWTHIQAQEEASLPYRNAILQRWSRKAKGATARPERGIMNKTANQATIIDALQEHLSNRERLLKRAHTPRSCAPLQLANKVIEDDNIYDDADFYGLLLKELLEQKSQDSAAASGIDLNFTLQREAKAKKNVDTKASKGRKLRYTVHEKLQNFMAPEDRSTWGERQTDELFGSLFGQSLGLGEGREYDEDMDDGVNAGEAGLMLFRN